MTNTTQQAKQRIIQIASQLDPPKVSAEASLMTGARLKAWSAETFGSRSAETPMPGLDKIDKLVTRKHKAYRTAISRAAAQLEHALDQQTDLLARLCDSDGNPTEEAKELAAEAVGPQADTCTNCALVVNLETEKMYATRCRNCHEYLRRKGHERPESLWYAS